MASPQWTHIAETTSTSQWLRDHAAGLPADRSTGHIQAVCWADYQTAGRGCGTNRWQSERGKNLLLSILTACHTTPARGQFTLSMAAGLAMLGGLRRCLEAQGVTAEPLRLKWPNDIYWGDRKLGGMLIEPSLAGSRIKSCIFGVGINVNQRLFPQELPNPVSLAQVTGHPTPLEPLLRQLTGLLEEWVGRAETEVDEVAEAYGRVLYRRTGYHAYRDAEGAFEAELRRVDRQGRLYLVDRQGAERSYAFKEVEFII